ncbi:hypothetical protein [Brevundimonas sp.]|uniref:hypothetical protein n=1 Tax=Brevundimonas sp. TaxID=1871086 RepID=UPI003D0F55B2
MSSFTRSRSFRRALTVIYWIALPLVLLSMVVMFLPGVQTAGAPPWLYAIGSSAFAALIGWRLWLNSRALGDAPSSSLERLLILVLLGLLALAGLAVALLGAAWIGIGIWLTVQPPTGAQVDFWPIGTGVIGLGTVALGFALTFPFIRAVRRAPSQEADRQEPES